ncbi:Rrf2 family transcriptional regulator [Natroniella sulfidigena]|uniref:RrF2 family transcriptional regulator n=1 Tax=Natroniella sulfidigena TaxID=723921 RepID=UPI00200A62D4|nr:Rrf2 family transcriptional regulator [Natroniella sulfidigena]MCK8816697.1 Rrf2 family transcriptional regulator [Natroniella sulfidigena]
MKLSQATDYAFRAILYLARQGVGEKVDAQTISEAEVIPKRFLLKIFRKLVQAGVVESYRGKYGGYALAVDPAKITLKDIVEIVEGKITVNRCLIDPDECNKRATNRCKIHNALAEIQQEVNQKLAEYNFAQFLD